ncbi:MAG: hypothetical protein AB7T06_16690 [Kofleriaceae bacterium]
MRRAVLIFAAGCGRVGFGSALDAADPDAPADAVEADADAAPACSAMFCDGFEDPALAVWGTATDIGASATRDAAFGFRGASLHATSPPGTSLAARFVDVFGVVAPADQWVRLYVYAPSGIVLDVEPAELTNAAGDHQIVFSLYDDAVDVHGHAIAGDFNALVDEATPRDQWICYELHVEVAANGLVELYRDGTQVVAQPAIDTRPSDGDLSRVRVGIPSKPTALDEHLFVDEVAADTARIGCL